MKRFIRNHRGMVVGAGLVGLALVAGVGLGPHMGFTAGPKTPLWTERAVNVAPTQVQAPNWVALAKALKPAVVNVSTKRVEAGHVRGPSGSGDPFEQSFRQFGDQAPKRNVRSLGSGFVINCNGHIVTNNHVVDGATEIRVKLSDGRELPAKIIGRDPKTDLSLLKVEATGLPTIPLGDSAELRVGEPVMAIGNPFGLEQTVTTGIVSATGRVIGEGPYDDFIQTDASINPGNSGGPLINARGQAIGINTAIFSQSGGSVGIGFAIPVNLAKSVFTQLAETGHVVRGWLGVTIQPLTPELATSFGLPDARGAGLVRRRRIPGHEGRREARRCHHHLRWAPGGPLGGSAPGGSRHADWPRGVGDARARGQAPHAPARSVGSTNRPDAAVAPTGQSRLGLAVEAVTPTRARELGLTETRGVLVQDVEKGSRAAHAGIQPGDVIVEIDHRSVETLARCASS